MLRIFLFVFLVLNAALAFQIPRGFIDCNATSTAEEEDVFAEILNQLYVDLNDLAKNGRKLDSLEAIDVLVTDLQVSYNSSVTDLTVAQLHKLKLPLFYFNHNVLACFDYLINGNRTPSEIPSSISASN
ncbi:hypothetical protein L596_008515 [Steinernema carpocapsae]|uniref:Uncharacterized protein n=1 Tax=Steinernema carpocapsae TaxID=34508 RepID=A0A4U5PD07_STECR|nr:hypothetical protein L596_008515 [Steinernema carpocapsae]